MDRQVGIPLARNVNMRRTIKPHVAPSEFMCRTFEVMWSSFMKENVQCTDPTLMRNGLHNFDFSNPILKRISSFIFIVCLTFIKSKSLIRDNNNFGLRSRRSSRSRHS